MKVYDLLEVAEGMGLTIATKFDFKPNGKHVWVGDCSSSMLNSSCKIFNPTIGDLILWLMDRGRLDIAYKFEVFFFKERGDHLGFYSLSEKTLKENLLNIVLQVIRAEKEK